MARGAGFPFVLLLLASGAGAGDEDLPGDDRVHDASIDRSCGGLPGDGLTIVLDAPRDGVPWAEPVSGGGVP